MEVIANYLSQNIYATNKTASEEAYLLHSFHSLLSHIFSWLRNICISNESISNSMSKQLQALCK